MLTPSPQGAALVVACRVVGRSIVALLLILAALLACGGENNAAKGPSAYNQSTATCSSDYDCTYGWKCVKDSLSFRGICARSVNKYGTPDFAPPSPNSMGMGSGNCQFTTDCPIGFQCVKSSGGLYGNCLK